MALQMIFCLEANKQSASDYVYIRDTIKRFYNLNNKIKITPIYMNGKSNYNSTKVAREIKRMTKDYIMGETVVLYCIDTDTYESNADQAKELDLISSYCRNNGCELIWFCHDIEEVYVGNKVPNNQKVKIANGFRRSKGIDNILEDRLLSDAKRKGYSNILIVLDKYLRRR